MKKKIILCGFVAIALLAIGVTPFVWGNNDKMIPGLAVNHEMVGGFDREQWERFIREQTSLCSEKNLILTMGKTHDEWSMKDLHIKIDPEKIETVWKTGRTSDLFSDWWTRWDSIINGKDISLPFTYDKKVLSEKVHDLVEKYGKEPKDAVPIIDGNGHVTFTKGVPYISLDEKSVYEAVEKALDAGIYTVEVPVIEEKLPMVTEEEGKQFTSVLGAYTTYFGDNYNRSHNIRLATEAVSRHIMAPGETFSFNEMTGMRSPEKGYLEAPVIVGDKLEPGYGGGVCQVSTTLFNAVILSGLAVNARESHYMPVSYVPIGRDATVSYGDIDLVFTNSFPRPVYVYATYSPGEVTCYILGNDKDKPINVGVTEESFQVISHKKIEKIDRTQKEEKKEEVGHDGYHVKICQHASWEDGRRYSDEFVSTYDPKDTVIIYKKDPKAKEDEKLKKEWKTGTSKEVKDVKNRHKTDEHRRS